MPPTVNSATVRNRSGTCPPVRSACLTRADVVPRRSTARPRAPRSRSRATCTAKPRHQAGAGRIGPQRAHRRWRPARCATTPAKCAPQPSTCAAPDRDRTATSELQALRVVQCRSALAAVGCAIAASNTVRPGFGAGGVPQRRDDRCRRRRSTSRRAPRACRRRPSVFAVTFYGQAQKLENSAC